MAEHDGRKSRIDDSGAQYFFTDPTLAAHPASYYLAIMKML